ncbi:MAG: hypothetical protein H6767_04595 [Candidatus Peribacteria bacterium]|nr:MAG: hypothetical protein H6767_04595 [Candidatus Peribacteria bacterium]
MKQDFLNYIQETFDFPPEEMEAFSCALSIPLKKTIRINTNKLSVEAFQKEAQKLGWRLSETSLGNNMCYIDRDDTTTALGNTLFHTNGYFYIQELAASSSPYYMSGDMVNPTPYTILDMSASPGGKTTQLAEYYSQSIIVANEIDKGRLKALYTNIDRMTAMSVVSTNYDGRFFKQVGELFDKVLLDAPCSGEGTGYKTDDALKYRNIKNIKRIAKLQFGLLEAAIQCCKPGGEIVYSTCTLNTIENEGVIEKALEKYGEYVELIRLLDNEE